MIFKILFVIFTFAFVFSIKKERRMFRNAIFFSLAFSNLFLSIAWMGNDALTLVVLYMVYIVIPLCLLLISFVFISAGIISIKKEGFNLSHSISILFGIGIWSTFFAVTILLYKPNISIFTSSALFLVVMIAGYVIFTFSSLFIYSQLYKLLPKNRNCDFILVHGAGLLDGERVSPLLKGRLNKAIEVFQHAGEEAKIIVSGGQGTDENITEAQAMKSYLLENGIIEHRILMEDKSTTTLENMRFSKKIIEELHPKAYTIFVTNDYHVFRTGTYAKKVGLNADGVGCKTAFYYWPNAFVREYVAIIIKYKIVPIIIFLFWLVCTINAFLPFNI